MKIVSCEASGGPLTGSRPSSSLWMGSSAKWSASLPSGWPHAMPKIRWPSRSARVCRIFPGARRSAKQRANALMEQYHV